MKKFCGEQEETIEICKEIPYKNTRKTGQNVLDKKWKSVI